MFQGGICLSVVLLVVARSCDCLECYTCSGVSDVETCLNISQCSSGQQCGGLSIGATGLVGREISERETQCHECCSTDRCNNQLCIHRKPTACIDDVKVDCAYLNAMFKICKDITHSKNVCPNFCGLCTLVDGNWAEWSQWSECDVTCETGVQTRTRTCTNPAPANQGIDCVGNRTDTKSCSKQPCPVHGGWTKWSHWEACSVTCDIGIQRRHRNCSNPLPSLFGDHCFGEPLDDRICMPGPCARQVVAFNAHYVTDVSPASGQTMVFSTVLLNKGAAYNSSTGIFIVPANGTYTFSAQLCITTKRNIHFSIIADSTALVSTFGFDYHNCECPSVQAVAILNKNQKVFVQWQTYSYSSINVVCRGSLYMNYFSGVLNNEW